MAGVVQVFGGAADVVEVAAQVVDVGVQPVRGFAGGGVWQQVFEDGVLAGFPADGGEVDQQFPGLGAQRLNGTAGVGAVNAGFAEHRHARVTIAGRFPGRFLLAAGGVSGPVLRVDGRCGFAAGGVGGCGRGGIGARRGEPALDVVARRG